MWFPYFALTNEDRIYSLVSYDSIVRPYRFIKMDYKQPGHKDTTNKYLPNTKPTIISKKEDTKDVSITDIPTQEPPTTYPSAAPTTQVQDKHHNLTKSILLKYIHQYLYSFPDI